MQSRKVTDRNHYTISFNSTLLKETSAHLQDSWIQNQIDYFDNTSKRYKRLEKRLHIALFSLFVIAVGACLSHLIPKDSWFAGADSIALLGTAAGPALAASLLGIATHAEWARLHRLYAARAGHYRKSLEQLQKITHAKNAHPTRREVADVLRPLAITSIQEVADWRWLHAVHDPHLH